MITPLFVPFKIRNQIINENNTKQKDICEFPTNKQNQILLSYMTEKNIYDGIKKRLMDKLYNKKSRNSFSTPYEAFKNGWSEEQIKEWIRKYPIKGAGNMGNAFITFQASGFDDSDLKAYWKFDETSGNILNSSLASASSGSSAELIVTGMTYNQAQSPFNYSGLLDGVDDFLKTSTLRFNEMHQSNAKWTVCMWFRITSLGDEDLIWNNIQATNIGIDFRKTPDDAFTLYIRNATGSPVINYDSIGTAGYIPDNTNWHFYVTAFDHSLGANNARTKRDNSNLIQIGNDGTPSSSNTGDPLHIGCRSNGNTSQAFPAYLSEWSLFYADLISDTRATTLYNSGNGKEIY